MGYMIKSGDAANHYLDSACRSIKLKQGVLGIKVAIMLPHDPTGKNGTACPQPDIVTVFEPKAEEPLPVGVNKGGYAQNVQQPAGAMDQMQQQQQQQQQAPVQQ